MKLWIFFLRIIQNRERTYTRIFMLKLHFRNQLLSFIDFLPASSLTLASATKNESKSLNYLLNQRIKKRDHCQSQSKSELKGEDVRDWKMLADYLDNMRKVERKKNQRIQTSEKIIKIVFLAFDYEWDGSLTSDRCYL